MKIGDVVAVYEDPITCERLEGYARLIELVRPDRGDGLSLWYVRFGDNSLSDNKCIRTVNVRTTKRIEE